MHPMRLRVAFATPSDEAHFPACARAGILVRLRVLCSCFSSNARRISLNFNCDNLQSPFSSPRKGSKHTTPRKPRGHPPTATATPIRGQKIEEEIEVEEEEETEIYQEEEPERDDSVVTARRILPDDGTGW